MADLVAGETLPEVASLWIGGGLSFTERLCLKSFADMGHPTTLYAYGPISGVPEGVRVADANDILPSPDTMVVHPRTGSPAPFADRFRYHLLRKRPGLIWADTDAYCLRPFRPVDGYFLGFCDRRNRVANNGVLALPPHSPALQLLLAFTSDESLIPPWLPPALQAEAQRRSLQGDPMHVTEMPWGIWGPSALSWALRQTGEISHTLPFEALYPITFDQRRLFFRQARRVRLRLTPDTRSIHFYGRRVRRHLEQIYEGRPPEGSILHHLAQRHGMAEAFPAVA